MQGTTLSRVAEEPPRAGRPRGHRRGAQTLGCGGSTSIIPVEGGKP